MSSIAAKTGLLCALIATMAQGTPATCMGGYPCQAMAESCSQDNSCQAPPMKAQTDGVSLIQFQRRLGSLVLSGQAPAAKTNGTAASNDTAKEDAPAVAVNTSTSSDTGAPPAATENASGNASGNATANVTNATNGTNGTAAPVGCATKKDPRATAWFAETAAEGTPCLFGVDVRDEGTHCILSEGQYGSNGWCYTSMDFSSWGSCNEKCPLYGPAGTLGSKIEGVAKTVAEIHGMLNGSVAAATTSAPEAATEADVATTAAPAKDAKPDAAEEKEEKKEEKKEKPEKESAFSQVGSSLNGQGQQEPNSTTAAPSAADGNKTAAPEAASDTMAPATNASAAENVSEAANASNASNASNSTANATVVKGCATKEDSRIAAWFAESAAAGTPCVFGVDVRDEGGHCIYSEGKYGSNGWCYTSQDQATWGSCNEHCPLYGAHAALSHKIDEVIDQVQAASKTLEGKANATDAKPADATPATTEAPADNAAEEKPEADAKPAADAKEDAKPEADAK